MLKNNRHLLACCAVCGAVVAYLVSIYIFVIVVVTCVLLLVIDFKLLEQVSTATKTFSFPVPSWIKTIITALMNSYHLSKPLEPEPSSRRGSLYSPNVLIPRRPNCRSSRYTCLDENTDYVNRRNGMGLCNPSSPFNASYSNSLHGLKRNSNFNDSDNSSKTEDFISPHSSPWARRQNYSGSDFNNVRRVQTIAGPLLASSGLTKRVSNDFGLLVDASSPGLASRIVQYREDGTSPGSTVWTHQPQYSSPGQFPMVHLTHSPSSLPVLSPMSSQKASRRSVRVKIAPPDPLGSRLYPLSTKTNTTYTTTIQTDHSTKSVLETLKEISRKRIHSQLEDNDDDVAKRQKRSDLLPKSPSGDPGEGENMSKRIREESPRHLEASPPVQPTKRIRNNEILSSLSSSRKFLQSGGVKRKTQNLDWSRCSTPVLGKQQKTAEEDSLVLPPLLSNDCGLNIFHEANDSLISQASDIEVLTQSGQRSMTTPEIGKRKTNGLSWTKTLLSENGTPEITSKTVSVMSTAVNKSPTSLVNDSPWQKDSPFVIASSADDVIDDVSALEEKREEDRRSRLMSMMTVISGGEPPVKMPETIASQSATMHSVVSAGNSQKSNLSSDKGSLQSSSVVFSSIASATGSGNTLLAASTMPKSWSSNAANSEESTTAAIPLETTQISDPVASVVPSESSPASGTDAPNSMTTTSPMFGIGNITAGSVIQKPQDKDNATDTFTTPSTGPNTRPSVSSVFGPPSTTHLTSHVTSVSSSPVFGSIAGLFGSKPATSAGITTPSFSNKDQHLTGSVAATTNSPSNFSYGFTSVPNTQVPLPTSSTQPSSSTVAPPVTSVSVTSTPMSSVFQLRPAVSGLGQDNTVSSSSGCFSASVGMSPSQANTSSKAINFAASEKTAEHSQLNNCVPAVSEAVPFDSPARSSASQSALSPAVPSFGFGTSVSSTTPTSGLQMKSGIFPFGSSSPGLNSLTTLGSGSNKPMFGSSTGGFGQTMETPVSSNLASNQLVNTQPVTSKVGGFSFPLPIGSPTNMIGNSASEAGNEQKHFTFGSAKPVENPFALNASNNNSVAASQAQIPTNPFGSSTMQQKSTVGGQQKESLFSFGGNAGTPQSGGFPMQAATSSATPAIGGFSLSSAPAGVFNQPATGASGFPLQPAVASTDSFSTPTAPTTTPTTHAGSAFGFGSTVSNQTTQSNPFAFGNSKNATETQPGNLFAFGSTTAPARPANLFGASATPAGQSQPPVQSVSAGPPTQPFQFGSSTSTPQLSGAFSFGASPNVSNAASAFPSGGSFQINATSGFGSGPAMFSIGSGSTAPRIRNSRNRRTK